MIDVAGWKGVDALPSSVPTGPDEIRAALEARKMDRTAGDIIFLRTGTLGYWGDTPASTSASAARWNCWLQRRSTVSSTGQ